MTISGSSILADPPMGAHIVYPYTDERSLIEAVRLYVAAGLGKGEAVVLIMTLGHCTLLEERLLSDGFDLEGLKRSGQYMCVDAARTLESIKVDRVLDQDLFDQKVGDLIQRAKDSGAPLPRSVRAFGEMVNLLYLEDREAALTLEGFWNEMVKRTGICLFCTYELGSTRDSLGDDICREHSHFLA